jgi:hypothetical protein
MNFPDNPRSSNSLTYWQVILFSTFFYLVQLYIHSRCYCYRGALKYHIKTYDLVIRDLSKAASIDSTCVLAYFNRAVCFQENRDYQKVTFSVPFRNHLI